METLSSGNWFSVSESIQKLNISRKTLYRWIKNGKVTTEKRGQNRLIWIDDVTPDVTDTVEDTTQTAQTTQGVTGDSDMTQRIQYFRDKCDRLEIELSEQSKRHDTIILQMSQQNQLLLDQLSKSKNKPFWKFW